MASMPRHHRHVWGHADLMSSLHAGRNLLCANRDGRQQSCEEWLLRKEAGAPGGQTSVKSRHRHSAYGFKRGGFPLANWRLFGICEG